MTAQASTIAPLAVLMSIDPGFISLSVSSLMRWVGLPQKLGKLRISHSEFDTRGIGLNVVTQKFTAEALHDAGERHTDIAGPHDADRLPGDVEPDLVIERKTPIPCAVDRDFTNLDVAILLSTDSAVFRSGGGTADLAGVRPPKLSAIPAFSSGWLSFTTNK